MKCVSCNKKRRILFRIGPLVLSHECCVCVETRVFWCLYILSIHVFTLMFFTSCFKLHEPMTQTELNVNASLQMYIQQRYVLYTGYSGTRPTWACFHCLPYSYNVLQKLFKISEFPPIHLLLYMWTRHQYIFMCLVKIGDKDGPSTISMIGLPKHMIRVFSFTKELRGIKLHPSNW